MDFVAENINRDKKNEITQQSNYRSLKGLKKNCRGLSYDWLKHDINRTAEFLSIITRYTKNEYVKLICLKLIVNK